MALSLWLSWQHAQPIPATRRSSSYATVHRRMLNLAIALIALYLPLTLDDGTHPIPVLDEGTHPTHVLHNQKIRVRIYTFIRAERGAHTGFVTCPLHRQRCVLHPRRLTFRRGTGEIKYRVIVVLDLSSVFDRYGGRRGRYSVTKATSTGHRFDCDAVATREGAGRGFSGLAS